MLADDCGRGMRTNKTTYFVARYYGEAVLRCENDRFGHVQARPLTARPCARWPA